MDWSRARVFDLSRFLAFSPTLDWKKFTIISDSSNFTQSTVVSLIDFTVCMFKEEKDLAWLSFDCLFIVSLTTDYSWLHLAELATLKIISGGDILIIGILCLGWGTSLFGTTTTKLFCGIEFLGFAITREGRKVSGCWVTTSPFFSPLSFPTLLFSPCLVCLGFYRNNLDGGHLIFLFLTRV